MVKILYLENGHIFDTVFESVGEFLYCLERGVYDDDGVVLLAFEFGIYE